MSTLELKTSGRQFRRQFLAAIRGNLIRALTELITNSDDSYRRLEARNPELQAQPGFGAIFIDFDRKQRSFSVTDWAEGMNAEDMRQMIPSYGAATSGLYQDQSVRGYFGKGLKDVLFSMPGGLVQSIKDGRLYSARFYWEGNAPFVEIDERPEPATSQVREQLNIPRGNGTRVSFTTPPGLNLPRHESLLNKLSNYSMLRLINSNNQRNVILCTQQAGKDLQEDRIRYHFPNGELVFEDDFTLEYEHGFPVHMKLFRANSPLTQSGDEREGGLLIYDEGGAVLDLTLFGFDRDDQAARLFGWLIVQDFRRLLKKDENVLTDTRDGLDRHHPFTQALSAEVEARLKPVVEHERHLRLQNSPSELSRKQRKRLGHSIDQINSLLGDLTDIQFELDQGESAKLELPPEAGLEFRPQSVSMPPGSRMVVSLRIDSSQIAPGTPVELNVQGDHLVATPSRFQVTSQPGKLISVQNILLRAEKSNEPALLTASTDRFQAEMSVRVKEDRYPTPRDGMEFIPAVMHLASNSSRSANLYIQESILQRDEKISFATNNLLVEIDPQEAILKPSDFRDGIACVKLRVRGGGIGERAAITATTRSQETSLAVAVVSKREKQSSGPRLVTGFRFDRMTPSRVRASYDQETGLIWIYLRNPVVGRYFGDLPLNVALNAPHCQILLAEIILEQIAWIARRKMIESGAEIYISDHHTEEDLEAVRRFMAEYGNKIHSWIADDRIIAQAIENVAHKVALQQGTRQEMPAVPPTPIQPPQPVPKPSRRIFRPFALMRLAALNVIHMFH